MFRGHTSSGQQLESEDHLQPLDEISVSGHNNATDGTRWALTMADTPTPPQIVQTAYFVEDARTAAIEWVRRFGAGPFFLIEHIPLEAVTVHGQPGDLDHTSAYGWQGNLMVELVQQNCSNPSIFKGRPYGLHHLAHFVDNLDDALARYAQVGIGTAMRAHTTNGTAFAFADATRTHGHYFELYERNEGISAFYAMVRQAAQDWDGTDPVRSLG